MWKKPVAAAVGLAVLAAAGLLLLRGAIRVASPQPENLGVANGRLAPCPDSPNCVSTFATDEEHAIAPFAFEGDTAVARDRLLTLIQNDPRATLITSADSYIHAEYTTPRLRFIDDVEFLLDEATGTVHFRSASRLGYGDMGVNRSRMEAIRAQFSP